jgi:hypothetical protein
VISSLESLGSDWQRHFCGSEASLGSVFPGDENRKANTH